MIITYLFLQLKICIFEKKAVILRRFELKLTQNHKSFGCAGVPARFIYPDKSGLINHKS